ncbi:isocitrate/isopropylmalate dehydrogenase family protein [Saccharomonospora piscinae]|uniref:isocitrate/isopropylmalate dehydrogenase family protein n=1 Tax=Saccharomonospora piscinae TaxID=687388 RepID=UPI000465F624|nr:isocitrate/isopropylmalate dehydrogenase family protein [Saccharomonospora piscinae]
MTTVAVIPGDGVGPEVTEQAVHVLATLGLGLDLDVLDQVNADRFLRTGVAMTDDEMERARSADAVLFGAVGDPKVPDPSYARDVLLRLRFELDLYVNHRPAALLADRLSPLRDPALRALDCVVVRENTEGAYAGMGGVLREHTPYELALDGDISTAYGVTRVLEYAFAIARRSVCLVDKANAVPFGGGLWQRRWSEVSAAHPDVGTSHLYVDAAAMRLIQDPTAFDVIVTNNSYGDILSDVTAALAGGPGTAASANLNPRHGVGLFEPVHGSAPDIAGTGRANPVGSVLSAALLLDHLGHGAEGDALRAAVRATVAAGTCTPDLGGESSTKEVGAAITAEVG